MYVAAHICWDINQKHKAQTVKEFPLDASYKLLPSGPVDCLRY